MNIKRINSEELYKALLSIFVILVLLHLGRLFLIPIAIATFLAMLFFPLAQKLERFNFKRSWAAAVCVFVLLVVIGLLHILVYFQVSALKKDFPDLEKKLEQKSENLKWLISKETGVQKTEQDNLLEEQKSDIVGAVTTFLKDFFVEGLYILLMFFVVLSYTFLILIYRGRIKKFFLKLNIFNTSTEASAILSEIAIIAHQYLKGVFTVISILAVIYGLGFWLLGIKHALLFAIITALLRVIPYIGSFTGIAFPITFAFLTQASLWYPIGVLIFFMATQLLEAYFLTPFITGKKINLNPLATITAILFGYLVWGVLGMVLFVPLCGILKVTFDRIPQLAPFGYLLGKDED